MKFRPGAPAAAQTDTHRAAGGRVIAEIAGTGLHRVAVAAGDESGNLTGRHAAEEGMVGVAPHALILSYKACLADGTCNDFAVTEGIRCAIADGAKVINLSLGGPDFSQSTFDAIQDAGSAGIVVVAAAGNDGTTAEFYPAAHPNVVSVGAFDEDHKRAYFSNCGNCVDISAPGNVIFSTYSMVACGGASTLPGETGCSADPRGVDAARLVDHSWWIESGLPSADRMQHRASRRALNRS